MFREGPQPESHSQRASWRPLHRTIWETQAGEKRHRKRPVNHWSSWDFTGKRKGFLGDKHFISIVENYLLYLVKQRSMSAVESSTSPMSPGVMNHSMGPPPPSLSTHRFKRHSGLNQPKLIIPQQSISEESLNNSPGAEMQPLRSVESLFGLCTSWTLILFAMARTFFLRKRPHSSDTRN